MGLWRMVVEYYGALAYKRREPNKNTEEGRMAVISLASQEKSSDRGKEYWLRRQAIQVAAQLPEDREHALKVLEFAGELVRNFLGTD